MSDKKLHFILHPLCQSDPKVSRLDLENLDDYIKDSPNPRWDASFIVRLAAQGLLKIDLKLSTILANLADDLQFTDGEFDSVIWRGYISIAYGVIIGAIIVFWMRPLLK